MFTFLYFISSYFILFVSVYLFITQYLLVDKKPIIIAIDGNIGSGKSTFLALLKKHYSHIVYFAKEPVDEWQTLIDEEGNDILHNFYNNKNRWAYTFQNLAFITRVNEIDKAIKTGKKIIITERSVLTDYNIFAKSLFNQGCLSNMEMQIYKHWFNKFSYQVHKQVYIKTSVQNCLQRVRQRGREGEGGINKQYLQLLHDKHEQWLGHRKDVITIDGDLDFINDSAIQLKLILLLHKLF